MGKVMVVTSTLAISAIQSSWRLGGSLAPLRSCLAWRALWRLARRPPCLVQPVSSCTLGTAGLALQPLWVPLSSPGWMWACLPLEADHAAAPGLHAIAPGPLLGLCQWIFSRHGGTRQPPLG